MLPMTLTVGVEDRIGHRGAHVDLGGEVEDHRRLLPLDELDDRRRRGGRPGGSSAHWLRSARAVARLASDPVDRLSTTSTA